MKKLSGIVKAKPESLQRLLVVVMAESREHHHHHLCGMNVINQSMLLCDTSAPAIFATSFEWFGMPRSEGRMVVQFGNQCEGFLVNFRLISVASFCSALPTMRLSAFTAFRISSSSAEMMASWRKSS